MNFLIKLIIFVILCIVAFYLILPFLAVLSVP